MKTTKLSILFLALATLSGCAAPASNDSKHSAAPTEKMPVAEISPDAGAAAPLPAAAEAVSPQEPSAPVVLPKPILDSLPASPPRVRRVVIISIDGLRPDVLLRARMPAVRQLMQNGSYSFFAHTVKEAYTLPAHISMLTGVVPDRHGITWNDHIEEAYSNVPTIFDLAKKAGMTTAAITGKTKFICLQRPGVLDFANFGIDGETPDALVASRAATLIHSQKPQVIFVHLAEVDEVGHRDGWGTPQQLAAAVDADQGVRIVVQALMDEKLMGETLVILTADHGGEGINHGPGDERSALIPWIAAGPGVRKDFDLTRFAGLHLTTQDTFATACMMLGLEVPGPLDSRPVTEILESTPLPWTQPATAPVAAQ